MQWGICATLKYLPHLYILDDRMLREEDPHLPRTENAASNTVTARVYFNSPNLAQNRSQAFDTIWQKVNRENLQM